MSAVTQTQNTTSGPPPPGVYVPAVLFFNPGSEDIDEEAYKKHILRLAEVRMDFMQSRTRAHKPMRFPPRAA